MPNPFYLNVVLLGKVRKVTAKFSFCIEHYVQLNKWVSRCGPTNELWSADKILVAPTVILGKSLNFSCQVIFPLGGLLYSDEKRGAKVP